MNFKCNIRSSATYHQALIYAKYSQGYYFLFLLLWDVRTNIYQSLRYIVQYKYVQISVWALGYLRTNLKSDLNLSKTSYQALVSTKHYLSSYCHMLILNLSRFKIHNWILKASFAAVWIFVLIIKLWYTTVSRRYLV